MRVLPKFLSSIKGRVVVGVSVLVIFGLVASDVAGIVRLRSYLSTRINHQIDSALTTTKRLAARQAPFVLNQGRVARLTPRPGIQAPSPVLIVIYGPTGSIGVVRYSQLGSVAEPRIPSLASAKAASFNHTYFSLPGQRQGASRFRARLEPLPRASGSVLVAVSLDELNSTISHLGFLDAVIGIIVLLILVTMTYLLVWLGMRPLTEMEEATDAIAGGDLSLRLANRDSASEVKKLANAFNAMLEGIQDAFEQVQQSERTSRESQDQLRRFVADAGHELRTPLTSILGYSELLQRDIGSDIDLVRASARRVQQESQRMSGLVDELLLLARLDQRKAIRFDRVDVLGLVADGVQDARVTQPERNIRLEPLSSPMNAGWLQPMFVVGDEETLRQVVSNLINNALFHTTIDAEVVVRVGPAEMCVGESGISPGVAMEVEDHGQGIPPESLEHLFERFYRVDNNRGFDGGFGLGLSVVESVVASHGGIVTVTSEVGVGTRFRVTLPEHPRASTQTLATPKELS